MEFDNLLYILLSQFADRLVVNTAKKWADLVSLSTITKITLCVDLVPSNLLTKSIVMYSHFHFRIG